jgi:hypothetical protein
MKRAIAAAVVFAAVVGSAALLGSDEGRGESWLFLDPASLADLGLVAHSPRGGVWGLEEHEEATGGRALANHEGEPGAAPAMLLALEPRSRDLRARTRCKVVSTSLAPEALEEGPAACGVVFRYVDDSNHWVVRADAAAATLEVAAVVSGREHVVAHGPVPASLGSWIELSIEARGDIVRVSLEGRPTLMVESPTLPAGAGSVGLWVPSSTTAFFDHFAIETLSPVPRALEILPLLGRRPG